MTTVALQGEGEAGMGSTWSSGRPHASPPPSQVPADGLTTAAMSMRRAQSMRGRFAVAERLPDGSHFLCVDRFAQETLCWRVTPEGLRVADRADVLGAGEIDPQAILDYLFLHAIPSPRTIFRGVHRLPPGHHAVIAADGQADVTCHAPLRFAPLDRPDFDVLKRAFRQGLEAAVRAELEPGIPACFLSGGTDSSTIAGTIKHIAGEVHTYSIGFEAEGYDEMAYARIAAKHFGATHHEYYVTPDDLVRSIADVAAAYDQPFGNSSALPAYYCALRAREDGVTKLLAGDGGDELFGGNARYATQSVYAHWHRLPSLARASIKPMLALPGADRVTLLRKGRSYVRAAELGLPDRLHDYNLLLRLGVESVLEPGFHRRVDLGVTRAQAREVWSLADAQHDLDRMLAYDWRYTLAESDLPKVRGTSRLAGIRVGYPMLDDDLVDFSMRLPADYKLKGQQLRWFFKAALGDFLPEAIIKKEKKGFGLPFGVWATRHGALKALAVDSLKGFATRGVVRQDFIRDLLDHRLHEHPGYYGEMVWILMMLEQWLRHHAPDWRWRAD